MLFATVYINEKSQKTVNTDGIFKHKEVKMVVSEKIPFCKAGILVLISILFPLLCLAVELLPGIDRSSDSYYMALLAIVQMCYLMYCFFVLAWGTAQVIWRLPCRKTFRVLLFSAWLTLYPALCWVTCAVYILLHRKLAL